VQGANLTKVSSTEPGDLVAIGMLEHAAAGQAVSLNGQPEEIRSFAPTRPTLYAMAVSARNRQDDVRVSGALAKLVDEDPGLELIHDTEMGQVLLAGQGEGHVRLALDRLKRRFGVDVATERPRTPYRETIIKGVTQRGRHKKQTGGHGQFGDVTVELRPLERGAGFTFVPKITGGVVPKQWIPAVEQGARDGLLKGPLGFPVVDLEVTLIDGSHHSVDSSEMAFRTAGRIAIEEGLRGCGSVLLEPIEKVVVYAPSASLSNITSALSARRGQILGFGPREGWPGWERIEAYLPQSERHDLIAEIRSITQGLGTFEADFDHMAELTGRLAEEIAHRAPA
jgi:elongation factor G